MARLVRESSPKSEGRAFTCGSIASAISLRMMQLCVHSTVFRSGAAISTTVAPASVSALTASLQRATTSASASSKYGQQMPSRTPARFAFS